MALPNEKERKAPVFENVPMPQIFVGSGKRHFLNILIVVAKHKVQIICAVLGTALLSGAISFVLPVYYTANAKMLPPQQNQSVAMTMLGQLGPLIGATAGKDLGLHNPNDLYIGILHSRSLEDALIERFSLMKVYGKKTHEDARRRLESLTSVVSGKDNIISISVDDRSANRAAEIANGYVDELQKLTSTVAITDAARRRVFFAHEMKAAADDLSNAEEALKKTQESTGIIQLDSQSKVMLQGYADLRAQIAAKEVQIQAMRSFATPENPDYKRALEELGALRAQEAVYENGRNGSSSIDVALSKVPSSGLEYVRRLREVKYRESLLELLTKQYEIAHIDEAKDSSIIQVLDTALPPERKSWPHRGFIVILLTMMAFFGSVVFSYIYEAMQQAKEDPEFAVRMHLLKFYLHGNRNQA